MLNHVAANLFRKLCAKFHHNCPSFVGDITENILVSFFSGHGVVSSTILITTAVTCRPVQLLKLLLVPQTNDDMVIGQDSDS